MDADQECNVGGETIAVTAVCEDERRGASDVEGGKGGTGAMRERTI